MRRPSLPTRTLCESKALLNGCSQIFLQQHPLCGLLILLAIAVAAPQLLGGALLGGFAAGLTARQRHYAEDAIEAGLYSYNGVLLGLLLCYTFAWSPLLPLLIIASGGISAMLLNPLLQRSRQRQWLPAYTSPFVLLSWLLLVIAAPLQLTPAVAIASPALSIDGLTLCAAVARGLGQVIFLDQPLAGLILFAGLLVASRRAACWALLGSAAGLGLALLQGWPTPTALAGLYGYNAALAAIALSQNCRQPWAPLLGIVLALLLQPGFAALGLPALTAPFILACWVVQAGSRLLRNPAADWRKSRG
ncbi:urea transporter [Pseudomonas sp. 2FG]|uniref:urea transporter n=1 Tax=Pseudomonas sp. 2FG TaxID=2502191 RepID=UPI0010F61848|nr:urea transporter [Pseudomonas sp. 2FG]